MVQVEDRRVIYDAKKTGNVHGKLSVTGGNGLVMPMDDTEFSRVGNIYLGRFHSPIHDLPWAITLRG